MWARAMAMLSQPHRCHPLGRAPRLEVGTAPNIVPSGDLGVVWDAGGSLLLLAREGGQRFQPVREETNLGVVGSYV